MNDKLISLVDSSYHNILLFSDVNYFKGSAIEIEQIAAKRDEGTIHFLNIKSFASKEKFPLYYKYNCIFVDVNYLNYLKEIKYYIDDHCLLIMIVEHDFEYSNNVEVFSILENNAYNVTLIEYNGHIVIKALK